MKTFWFLVKNEFNVLIVRLIQDISLLIQNKKERREEERKIKKMRIINTQGDN